MSTRALSALLLLASAAGCGRDAGSPPREAAAADPAAEPAGDCRILTAADIKAVTGADVHLIARGASAGAGGTCGNYATAGGRAYLGVNALQTASEYDMAVAAVPEDVYPKRRPVAGLGDRSILMKDETGRLRYLVAVRDAHGVVLFPLSGAREMSDAQLGQLAARALNTR